MTIELTNAADYEGDFDDDAISPVTQGESVSQAVLRRPTEALRARQEILRTSVIDLQEYYLSASNTVFVCDEDIVYDGAYNTLSGAPAAGVPYSGRLRISGTGNLLLQPSHKAQNQYAELTLSGAGGGRLYLQSKKYAYQGANYIQIEVLDDGTHPVTVEMDGGPGVLSGVGTPDVLVERRIKVHVDTGTPSSLAQVRAAIIADTDANALVTATVLTAGDAFAVPVTNLSGGVDYELHTLSDVELQAFFDQSNDNLLQPGNTLAVSWAVATSGSGDSFEAQKGRLARTSIRGNESITANMLFNTARFPENVDFCTPIFHAYDHEYGYLATNERLDRGKAVKIGTGAISATDLSAHLLDLSNPHEVTAAQVDAQGGSEQLVAQINAGVTLLSGPRLAAAETGFRGAVKINNAMADPIAVTTTTIGVANGVPSTDSDNKLAKLHMWPEMFMRPLGTRKAASVSGWVDIRPLTTETDLDIFLDGDAADGTYDPYFVLNDEIQYIYLKMLIDGSNVATAAVDYDVNIYHGNAPYDGSVAGGPSTQTFSIPTAAAPTWYELQWDTDTYTDLDPGTDNQIFCRLRIQETTGSGTGEAFLQYAELGYSRVTPV